MLFGLCVFVTRKLCFSLRLNTLVCGAAPGAFSQAIKPKPTRGGQFKPCTGVTSTENGIPANKAAQPFRHHNRMSRTQRLTESAVSDMTSQRRPSCDLQQNQTPNHRPPLPGHAEASVQCTPPPAPSPCLLPYPASLQPDLRSRQ